MLSFTDCRILVAGDIMLDVYMATHVGRISPEAPVPVARIQKHWSVPGGAANVARNLVCLGCRVTLAGLRGHDDAGEQLQRLLTAQGIRSRLVFTDDRPTPCKTRVVSQGQQLLRLDNEEQDDLTPAVLEELWTVVEAELAAAEAASVAEVFAEGLRAARCEINGR